MTDVPEKIWLTGFVKDEYGARLGRGTISDLDHGTNPEYPGYTRTDLHLALMAAEREAVAEIVDEYKNRADARASVSRGVGKHEAAERHESQAGAAVSISAYIRALTPDDAQAALEAVKREARLEGMRVAAEVAEDWFRSIGHGNPQDEIRALIKKDQADG